MKDMRADCRAVVGWGKGDGRLATIAIGTKRPIVGVGVGVGIPPLRHNEGSPKKYANRGSHCAGGNYACVCVWEGVRVRVCMFMCVFMCVCVRFASEAIYKMTLFERKT